MTSPYQLNSSFWNKTKPKTFGDVLGRPKAVEMLGDIKDKLVLDAGCGTGFVSRMLVKKGASVVGYDLSQKMIATAISLSSGIREHYEVANVQNLPEPNDVFDHVISVSVLMHLSPSGVEKAVRESYRVLKNTGTMVMSIPHPDLFLPNSPARSNQPYWVKMIPLDRNDKRESQLFRDVLYDIDGKSFEVEIFSNTKQNYLDAFIKAGFEVDEVREPFVRKEHLLHPSWGNQTGFPAYLQIRAIKGGRK